MGIRTAAKDYPAAVNLVLGSLVAMHATLGHGATRGPFLELGSRDDAWAIYVAYAGAIAVLGGFAGVVLVFAMGDGERVAKLRYAGGTRLAANWMSPVSSALVAVFVAILATAFSATAHPRIGAALFEGSVVITLHASLRLMWLLSALMKVVRAQDSDALTPAGPSVADLARARRQRDAQRP